MGNSKLKYKYVVFGDGNSPHLLKWLKSLEEYFDLYLITFSKPDRNIYRYVREENVFYIKMNRKNYEFILKLKKVLHILDKINPHIVHAHYMTSYGFLASVAKKLKKINFLIISAWGSDVLLTPQKNIFYKQLTKYCIKKADLVTSDSFHMTDKILSLYNYALVLTFPFGVEEIPRCEFYEKENGLFFSNRALEPIYQIEKVINIFEKIRKFKTNAKLIIANKGSQLEKLKKLVSEKGLTSCVEFVGYLSKNEMDFYYKKALWYFSLPLSDSTSVSLLEAMSFGCIPIASNIPANREWLIDSLNGKLIGLGNYLYSDINQILLMEEYAQEIFLLNRTIIRKRATWNDNFDKFIRKILEMKAIREK